MSEDNSNQHYILNRGNLIWLVVCIILALAFGFLYHDVKVEQVKEHRVNSELTTWQNKVDALRNKNDRVIYLPKPGDVHLTADQSASVQQLQSLFTQLTTFEGQTAYNTNYQYAKSVIHDPNFFKKYWQAPYDHGTPVVETQNIRFKNIRTQVLLDGGDKYTVIVTYIPYHNSSDLYQQKKLETRSRIYYVQGHKNNWTSVVEAQDMLPNSQIYYDSDIED